MPEQEPRKPFFQQFPEAKIVSTDSLTNTSPEKLRKLREAYEKHLMDRKTNFPWTR